MHVELCDGCSKAAEGMEEVGFLGHVYCVPCMKVARKYVEVVTDLRAKASMVFTIDLQALRETEEVAALKLRPDQP